MNRLLGIPILLCWLIASSGGAFAQKNKSSSRAREPAAWPVGETRSETFRVGKGGLLNLSSSQGDVFITAWDKNEVTVTVEGVDQDAADALKMSLTGTVVRVDFYPVRSRWTKHVRFKIDVPREFNLDLRTGGGEIEIVGGMKGNLRGHTSGGDITLDDLDGRVDMTTSGGDIRTGRLLGETYLKTSGGDIRVEDAGAELDVQTSGGDIRIGNVGKWLDASTSGGDIIIGDVGGEARLNTSGGDIEVGRVSGGARINTAGGTIQLQSASGDVHANTAGGDIELYDITGTVEARTAGGDIYAELIPKGTGRSSLVTAAGDVTLYLDPRAKATIEARIRVDRGWLKWRTKNDSKRKIRDDQYEIRSEFKAERYEEDTERGEIRATYVINGGGERIWLETSHGNIEIRQRTARR